MIRCDCNGKIMLSCESKVVQNDEFLFKLEKKLITLSEKYGLGEVLFMEKTHSTTIHQMHFALELQKHGPISKYLMYGILLLMKYTNLLMLKALNH